MKNKKNLGDRMKDYEGATKNVLTPKTPAIMRLDGKGFSKFTKGRDKPYDVNFGLAMQFATQYLVKNIQGAQFGYTQSDEISILFTDYERYETDGWYKYNIQKMCSVAASIVTLKFNQYLNELDMMDASREEFKDAFFDARVFSLPKEEVVNYFIWRQQDCKRNAITNAANTLYSHKELMYKNGDNKIEMMQEKGLEYDTLPHEFRWGCAYFKDRGYDDTVRKLTNCDLQIPKFGEDRDYIDRFVYPEKTDT